MLIQAKKLSKTYGNKIVVNHLDLSIPRGSLVAYLGTNGAGKSTTIRMLTGLEQPSSGHISKEAGLKIGIVFQNSVLDDELSVRNNLQNRAKLYKNKDKAWLEELSTLIGLNEFLDQAYGTLSGGQRRRVDIARALLHKPDILFLDEPTTGLDIQTRKMIWELLHHLKQQQGLTIVLTTHYLEEAQNADMTYIIDHGRLLAQGTAQELIHLYAKTQLYIRGIDPRIITNLDFPITKVEGGLMIEGMTSQDALDFLTQYRHQLSDFEFKAGTINEAFMAITGKEMP